MKSKALLLLLGLLLVMAVLVRCQEEEEEGGEEEKAPAKAKAPPAKLNKGGAPYTADIPLEALSKLPVEPLSMDAAALKDDDKQFELFLNGNEPKSQNVEALTGALNKATALMRKMQRDVEAEKVWTHNVYDIIQNYQYKYLKSIEDVKRREKKLIKMEQLVDLLKASTLRAGVEHELSTAEKALNELVRRAGPKHGGQLYQRITRRMAKLKDALREVQTPRQLHSETTARIKKILRSDLPPYSLDALSHLTTDDEDDSEKPKAKATATAAANKKADAKAKPSGKGKAKAKAKAKSKAPAPKKSAPKKPKQATPKKK